MSNTASCPSGGIPSNDEATQYRRAEKAWMHRDAERSWFQFTFTAVSTTQAVFLAVVSILFTRDAKIVSKEGVAVVFLVTAIMFLTMIVISGWCIALDHFRARHFERAVRAAEKQEKYDNKTADTHYDARDKWWRKAAWAGLLISIVALIITGGILWVSVLSMV